MDLLKILGIFNRFIDLNAAWKWTSMAITHPGLYLLCVLFLAALFLVVLVLVVLILVVLILVVLSLVVLSLVVLSLVELSSKHAKKEILKENRQKHWDKN